MACPSIGAALLVRPPRSGEREPLSRMAPLLPIAAERSWRRACTQSTTCWSRWWREMRRICTSRSARTRSTGSGKSTTLAALIDEINRKRAEHILTIEDPIEFVHRHKRCVVNQREIGVDATDFANALRAALRQDPDVILLGEMRDLETISTALTAAETGHLVFATLHTQSAPGTIDRVIDAFPAGQQDQIRIQLAATLEGVVTQALLPTADGQGRVPALEILFPDDAVRNLIRQAKVEQVYSVMQTGTAKGMQTMEQSLSDLTLRGVITLEAAIGRSSRPEQLFGLLERAGFDVSSEQASVPSLRVAEA